MSNIAKSFVEGFLDGAEEDFEKSILERMGKLVVVGSATIFVSWIAENSYDRVMNARRGRK